MRVGVALQYGLTGSGSCIYTRSVAATLAAQGHDVHLLSFETQPNAMTIFSRAWRYPLEGTRVEVPLASPAAVAGACVAHCIEAVVHPISYPRGELANSPLFTSLPDDVLGAHLARLLQVFRDVVEHERLEALIVNHAVVLPAVARRLGLPYVVVVHGSTLEYVVRRDPRYHALAREGLGGAVAVVALNADVRRRVLDCAPEVAEQVVELGVGVDAELFRPVADVDRGEAVEAMLHRLESDEEWDGMLPATRAHLRALGASGAGFEALLEAVRQARDSYRPTARDQDLPSQLRAVDWQHERIVTFVGKLLVDKGVHCLLAAAREVLRVEPATRFVVIGGGAFREGLEVLLGALDAPAAVGSTRLRLGDLERLALRCEPHCRGLEHLRPALGSTADAVDLAHQVIFTGYLGSRRLARLLALSHVSVVPSVIPEAFPLVVLEAASCGVLPLGSRLGGLTCALDRVGATLSDPQPPLHVDSSPEHMVADLADRIVQALRHLGRADRRARCGADLRAMAQRDFGWDALARSLIGLLPASPQADAGRGPMRITVSPG